MLKYFLLTLVLCIGVSGSTSKLVRICVNSVAKTVLMVVR